MGLPRRAICGGLVGGGLGAGLTVGTRAAASEELEVLGDNVDPRGASAVLRIELVEQPPPVNRHLAPGLGVLRPGAGLDVEALDIEVPVVALLAGALDRDPQRADRGSGRGLEELRVLGEVCAIPQAPTMQPTAGTQPARAVAADSDG
jgi:hypothetical protein